MLGLDYQIEIKNNMYEYFSLVYEKLIQLFKIKCRQKNLKSLNANQYEAFKQLFEHNQCVQYII